MPLELFFFPFFCLCEKFWLLYFFCLKNFDLYFFLGCCCYTALSYNGSRDNSDTLQQYVGKRNDIKAHLLLSYLGCYLLCYNLKVIRQPTLWLAHFIKTNIWFSHIHLYLQYFSFLFGCCCCIVDFLSVYAASGTCKISAFQIHARAWSILMVAVFDML